MRGYVATRWGQLHYALHGDAGATPTVVLLHENGVDMGVYERLIPGLAESVRVVAFDTPGHGSSDSPPAETSVEEYATTLAEGLAQLEVGKVVLVGTHTGASIAIELASSTHPERVAAIVLSGVPAYDEAERQRKFDTRPQQAPFTEDGSHLQYLWDRVPKSFEPMLRTRHVGGACNDPEHAFWGYHASFSYRPLDAIRRVTCPIAFVSSEIDPLYQGDLLAHNAAPDASFTLIDSEVFAPYWVRPKEYAAAILDVCRSVSPSAAPEEATA